VESRCLAKQLSLHDQYEASECSFFEAKRRYKKLAHQTVKEAWQLLQPCSALETKRTLLTLMALVVALLKKLVEVSVGSLITAAVTLEAAVVEMQELEKVAAWLIETARALKP